MHAILMQLICDNYHISSVLVTFSLFVNKQQRVVVPPTL